MSAATLSIAVLAGAVGVGYFVYGKRQSRMVPMLAGAGLCVIPYFVANVAALLLVCLVLLASPFVLDW
jgi:hypothetical protein